MSCKPLCKSGEKVRCSKIVEMNTNSFTSKEAVANFQTIANTLCSFKESIVHFVQEVSELHQALMYETNFDKNTVTDSIRKYNIVQQNFLNEIKALGDTKLSNLHNSIGVTISNNLIGSDLSGNLNNPLNYFTNTSDKNIIKICPSKTYYVQFPDGSVIPILNVPAFSFNIDKDVDNISLRVAYQDDIFTNRTQELKYFVVTPDSKDGFLYKDLSTGLYEGDLSDAHVPSELVNSSVNNLLEYYDSIVHFRDPMLNSPSQQSRLVTANDIDSILKFIDVSLIRINAGINTVNLKCKVLNKSRI